MTTRVFVWGLINRSTGGRFFLSRGEEGSCPRWQRWWQHGRRQCDSDRPLCLPNRAAQKPIPIQTQKLLGLVSRHGTLKKKKAVWVRTRQETDKIDLIKHLMLRRLCTPTARTQSIRSWWTTAYQMSNSLYKFHVTAIRCQPREDGKKKSESVSRWLCRRQNLRESPWDRNGKRANASSIQSEQKWNSFVFCCFCWCL